MLELYLVYNIRIKEVAQSQIFAHEIGLICSWESIHGCPDTRFASFLSYLLPCPPHPHNPFFGPLYLSPENHDSVGLVLWLSFYLSDVRCTQPIVIISFWKIPMIPT
jgi:hypothetical protein